jgi:hypothetical protein
MNNSKSLSKFKIFTALSASAFVSLAVNTANAANFGGVDVTPTVYEVTLKKIEFVRTDGSGAYTYAEGNFTFDIASGSAGSAVGSFAVGNKLEPGDYNGIRITVGRTFGLEAFTLDAGSGQPCRTDSAKGATGTLTGTGPITGVGDGTTDIATATTQSVPIPTGADITSALLAAGISELAGGDIMFTAAASMIIPSSASVAPAIAIDFDVTDAAELLTTAFGTCAAFPQPPTITVTVGN